MEYFLLLTRSKKRKEKILYYDRNISTKYIYFSYPYESYEKFLFCKASTFFIKTFFG